MADPYLGQIIPVGFNFAQRGWAGCEGQLLAISAYSALFSLLGTTFGGDGRTTFGLPDLRGRSMVGVGTGAGLSHIDWGEKGGAETEALTSSAQLPSHTHTLQGQKSDPTTDNPATAMLAQNPMYTDATNKVKAMNSQSIGNTGSSQSFDIRSPYLGVYINIALVGIYPSRS